MSVGELSKNGSFIVIIVDCVQEHRMGPVRGCAFCLLLGYFRRYLPTSVQKNLSDYATLRFGNIAGNAPTVQEFSAKLAFARKYIRTTLWKRAEDVIKQTSGQPACGCECFSRQRAH